MAAHDAVGLVHVGAQERAEPVLDGDEALVLVEPADIRLCARASRAGVSVVRSRWERNYLEDVGWGKELR